MTEQITLMRLWDSPRMKSYTTMQSILGFVGAAIPRTTTQINMGRSRNRYMRLQWLPQSTFKRFTSMLFSYFAKYIVCLPQKGILMQWLITPIWEFSKHRECLGKCVPSLNGSTMHFTKNHLRCFSSCFSVSKIVEGAATPAPAPSAACLHDTKLLTNLALSEFPFFKMEIIILPYLRGLVNVYTAL